MVNMPYRCEANHQESQDMARTTRMFTNAPDLSHSTLYMALQRAFLLLILKWRILLLKLKDLLVCVWTFCLNVYLCTMCMPGARGRQKKARELDPLKLELWMVTSHRVGTRTWTWILYKSNKCSKTLSHLSSHKRFILIIMTTSWLRIKC